jgi:hypothetical protein
MGALRHALILPLDLKPADIPIRRPKRAHIVPSSYYDFTRTSLGAGSCFWAEPELRPESSTNVPEELELIGHHRKLKDSPLEVSPAAVRLGCPEVSV